MESPMTKKLQYSDHENAAVRDFAASNISSRPHCASTGLIKGSHASSVDSVTDNDLLADPLLILPEEFLI